MSGDCIVVIPARGGSKRVPRKNIRLLAGRPLIAYTIVAAIEAGLRNCTFVSTEDAEIARIARDEGVQVIDRPDALASDQSSTESTLLHAFDEVVARGRHKPEWIVTLPPTSPFRGADSVRYFVAKAAERAADAFLSLTESKGDYWRCDASGGFARLFPNAPRRQQDREPLFEENSAIYVTAAKSLRSTGSVLGRRPVGIVIDALEGFDINTEADFAVAEALLASGVKPLRSPSLLACSPR